MASTTILREFERIRQALARAGIPVHIPWSLSLRDCGEIVITADALPDRPLDYQDLICTSFHYADGRVGAASSDLPLHRAIYGSTRCRAVLVCRPPHGMTLACVRDALVAGGWSVPVVDPARLPAGRSVEAEVATLITARPVVAVRTGAFVVATHDPASCLAAIEAVEAASVRELTPR
ncbi:MAG: class II aldolase/adducin family protein [Candidatus Riflebacteria bacterium]|nr:class II aldolase/adducin family protein [Candidatus Riflebacteria bacterium]